MFSLLAAVEGLVVLVAFFYLIHLVSTIRNGLQVATFWQLLQEIEVKHIVDEDGIKALSALGVINKQQAYTLKQKLTEKET